MRDRLVAMLAAMDIADAAQLIEVRERAEATDATVFVLGNGGSGSVAAHWVTDLGVDTIVPDRRGYRVVSLGDSPLAHHRRRQRHRFRRGVRPA